MNSRDSRPVLVVAGARPNFVKIAPILAALEGKGVATLLVHTGQHYSDELSKDFFRDLNIREPEYNLGVGSGSHAVQSARVMEAFEPVLMTTRPSWVIVVGDVNSTLATALVTAKLRDDLRCKLAHVEAGLRSRDWRMPEEVNRVLTDRLCDLLLTPSRDADANLVSEGIEASRIEFVGNVMIDTLLSRLDAVRELPVADRLGVERGSYVLVTVHRPSNVDTASALRTVLDGLQAIRAAMPVVFPLHPRTQDRIEQFGLSKLLQGIVTTPSLGYLDMLALTDSAAVVVTDSGGVQEETTALGIRCVTLREQTERPVTVTEGTNQLAPWPLTAEGMFSAFRDAEARGRASAGVRRPEGWDGNAAARIVAALASH